MKATTNFEPRWPVVLTILGALVLLALLPERIRLFPGWLPYLCGIVVITPIVAVGITSAKTSWLRAERTLTLVFSVVVIGSTILNLVNLVGQMVNRSGEISGLQLFISSIAVWVTNFLAFSMMFWQIDRGGPEARANAVSKRPDWLFPQDGVPIHDLPPDWCPTFVDYLFLGFCTVTAFSPTDALPITPRAKLLIMLESSMSLITVVVVASRAINILGSWIYQSPGPI